MKLGPTARWVSTVAMLTAALIVLRHLGGAELDPPSPSFAGVGDWLATRDGVPRRSPWFTSPRLRELLTCLPSRFSAASRVP